MAEALTRTGFIAGLAGLAAVGSLVVTSRTYRLTQQGQITDRYTKAIEQLSAEKLDVRVGGIYALERIAVDSKRDHATIVEVLSAFVRAHANPAREEGSEESESTPRPAVDIQAAVTVLGRLPHRKGVKRGDLQGALLRGGIELPGGTYPVRCLPIRIYPAPCSLGPTCPTPYSTTQTYPTPYS
ncbi:MAG: hypothetical protein ACRDSZ_01515 [Pseudonocardiaceae bacterium]